MPICVIDTSAVFADLNEETGAEEARRWLRDAAISAINLEGSKYPLFVSIYNHKWLILLWTKVAQEGFFNPSTFTHTAMDIANV